MTAQTRFALGLVLALQIVGDDLEHFDIGLDAFRLDRAAQRRVVARRGEPDRGVIADRDNGLRALAEGARAQKRSALVVLQRAEKPRDENGSRISLKSGT
jgi:hypothetical protein